MQVPQLTEITTRDNIIHQGIYYKPSQASKRALLWIHGLTSTYYNNQKLQNQIIQICEQKAWGFAAFNNRGHDIVTGIKKIDPQTPTGFSRLNGGSGYENFADCIFDIEASINFLASQGYTQMVLIGYSTGANKACFYGGSQKHPNLIGVILVSPTSDRLFPSLNRDLLKKDLMKIEKLIYQGKGDELVLTNGYFPMTPKRFVSLYSPHSLEDVFDYGDETAKLTYFSRINKPLLVLLGDVDESLDRPAQEVISVFNKFQKSVNYTSKIISNGSHSYEDKEAEVTKIIIDWITQL